MSLFGAIEAGGTKFICAIASSHEKFLAETTIETRLSQKNPG